MQFFPNVQALVAKHFQKAVQPPVVEHQTIANLPFAALFQQARRLCCTFARHHLRQVLEVSTDEATTSIDCLLLKRSCNELYISDLS